MTRSSLGRPAVETGFTKATDENFRNSCAASIVEELEVMTVTGGVRVCDGSSRGERFERAKGMHLIRDFQLPLGLGGESGELVYKEGDASAPPEIAILLMCVRYQPR